MCVCVCVGVPLYCPQSHHYLVTSQGYTVTGWRTEGQGDTYPGFPGGKIAGGKEGREDRKGSFSQTGKPNPDPSHLGNEVQLVDGRARQGYKSRCVSAGSFSPLLSHYSIIYGGIIAIY